MSSLILLSGPPGAGKSTVARELVASSAGPTVCIEGDKFWSFFPQDRQRLSALGAHPASGPGKVKAPRKVRTNVFRTMLWSITVAAMPCARAGYETIVDFSIPFWFIDPLRARFPDMDYDYIVLRPSESICAARIREGLAEGRFRLPPSL